MPADKITPSPFLLEALTDPRALLPSWVVCQRQILSGALLDVGGFLRCSWATFPRITLIHDEWKHPEGKKEVPLASIQQPRPLISAGTAHNEKGRSALTSRTDLCDKGTMTIDYISWYNMDCLVCVCCWELLKHFKYLKCFKTTFLCHTAVSL